MQPSVYIRSCLVSPLGLVISHAYRFAIISEDWRLVEGLRQVPAQNSFGNSFYAWQRLAAVWLSMEETQPCFECHLGYFSHFGPQHGEICRC